MKEKNDGIFLWMLERNRQSNRGLVFNKELVESGEQLSSAARALISSARNSEPEIRQSLPVVDDLAPLLGEQEDLEKESLRLDEEERELGLRAKALSEELVQEIKKRNDEKRKEISLLQAKISRMEHTLGELSDSGSVADNTVGNVGQESAKPMDSDSPRESLDSGYDGRTVEIIEEVNHDTRYRFSLKQDAP